MLNAEINIPIIKEKRKITFLQVFSSFNSLVALVIFITITSLNAGNINDFFNIHALDKNNLSYYSLKIYLAFLLFFVVVANILLLLICYKEKWFILINENLFIVSLLCFVSLNIAMVICLIKIIINKQKTVNFNFKQIFNNFKIKFGIKIRNTNDYVLIALFCSLSTALAYIESIGVLPKMPFGGDIGLKYIPLFLVSFLTSFIDGWITGAITALISIAFSGGYILSPWSYLFDYFLPLTTPAIVSFLPIVKKDNSIFTYISYFLHCFIVLTIIWIWQILAGYLFWVNIQPSDVWTGYTPLLYSIIYNFIHVFIFTYPIIQFVLPSLYRSMLHFKK